jgi:hypothetical protein
MTSTSEKTMTTIDATIAKCPSCSALPGAPCLNGFDIMKGQRMTTPTPCSSRHGAAARVAVGESNSVRKPFNNCAGYRASLRSGANKGWVVIYEASEQGIDAGGRYAIVCETHHTIAGATSMPAARATMKDPESFCEACRETSSAAA